MGRFSEASEKVEAILKKLSEAGWGEFDLPSDENGRAVRVLYYERAVLMWQANAELYDGTFVALSSSPDAEGFTAAEQEGFRDLPGNFGAGVNAVLSAYHSRGMTVQETLDDILLELPVRLKAVEALLVGPAAYYRQIGMNDLGFVRKN